MKKLTVFGDKVLALTAKIPFGKITSYQELARGSGYPGASRAVGQALNKNPRPIKIPCHRIVRANGQLGGFAKGTLQKKKLLLKEGIEIKDDKIVNFNKYFHKFK